MNKKYHPEQESDEIYMGNASLAEIKASNWKTSRLGNNAYDTNGIMIYYYGYYTSNGNVFRNHYYGIRPWFIKKQEVQNRMEKEKDNSFAVSLLKPMIENNTVFDPNKIIPVGDFKQKHEKELASTYDLPNITTSPGGNASQNENQNNKDYDYPMKTNNNIFSARTAALIAASETNVASGALALAAKKLKEDQAKEQAETALRILKNADAMLKDRVKALKRIREQEKEALKKVKEFDSALEAFTKTGDFEAFKKATGTQSYHFGL